MTHIRKLIEQKTGREIQAGDEITNFRGEKSICIGWSRDRNRVYTKDGEYFASVFNCDLIDYDDENSST